MRFELPERTRAFSLVEMLIVVSVIGIMSMLAIPAFSSLNEKAHDATAQRNAQNIAQISATLSQIGVAHVLPDSLGGVEATARLLREGVIVDRGPFKDQEFIIRPLSEEEITRAAKFLNVAYDLSEIRLIYSGPLSS
ncbi:MAG: prepilin-type N-terminal cleavage/methylation domain-containing protein [Verrucomicrobiae bacterium]|nr:prepilin-type N-terminal cleavage/methylation domain-containing protein [Verrucomicrobiae bacterium]